MWGVPGLPTFCWTSFPLFLRCQVWGVPGLPTFCWTSFPLFLRCQVWGVPGLPTFCWTSFPLSLRCQVWGVPGLPTFFGPHIPCSWGARCGEYLVCQHFVGPHFPYFWGARFGEYLVCQLFIGPHQRHTQQHWPPHSWSCSAVPLFMLSFCIFHINSQKLRSLKWMLQTLMCVWLACGNVSISMTFQHLNTRTLLWYLSNGLLYVRWRAVPKCGPTVLQCPQNASS